jgi:hypothetical protein
MCAVGGFALESRCHTGQVILYDTVQKLGWSVDVRNHGIRVVVDRLLGEDADWKAEFNEDNEVAEEEDEDEDKTFGIFRWGWGRGKKSPKEGDKGKRFREVPLPRPAAEVEGSDGVCNVCLPIFPVFQLLRMCHRTVLIGSMGMGISEAAMLRSNVAFDN